MKKAKKILLGIVAAILILAIVAVGGAYLVFRNEINTLMSIEEISDGPFYEIEYTADYGLDEFLEEGASTDSELAAFIIQKLMKGLPVNIELPDLSCSTYNAQLEDGDYVFGRNFDNKYAPMMVVHTDPDDGYASVSMVNLGYIGYGGDYLPDSLLNKLLAMAAPYIPLDGVNEAGLSIGVLQLYTEPTNQDNGLVDITTTAAIRLVLDRAATVDEAIDLLSRFDMHSSANASYHFQIADAQGNSAVVEYIEDEMSVVYSDTSYQWCTNFILTEGEYYNDGAGQDRYEILEADLTACDGILADETAAMQLLSNCQNPTHLNDDGDETGTLWSAVYNNTEATLTLCLKTDYETVYTYSVGD